MKLLTSAKTTFSTLRLVTLLLFTLIISFTSAADEQTSTSYQFVSEVMGKGNEPAVLLIPGLMSDSTVYDALAVQLAQSHEVHLISLKGFGKEPLHREAEVIAVAADGGSELQPTFSFETFGAELVQYIKQNKLQQPAIVGHSMGGLTALYLATYYPNKIGKVVSIDGLPFIGPIFTRTNDTTAEMLKPQATMMRSMFANMTAEQLAAQTRRGIYIQASDKQHQDYVVAMAKQSNPRFVGEVMHEVLLTDLRVKLVDSQVPILLLGASGGFTQKEQHQQVELIYRAQLEKVANATVIMNTDARHFIMLDDPEWLNAKLSEFL
jgi:pimeloyl-ACP methyl ester carboxylesterase